MVDPNTGFRSILVAAVLIEEGDRVLLIRESKPDCAGKLNQPAGHLEVGETPEECARREAREEAGYEVELTGLLGVYLWPQTPTEVVVRFCYLARPVRPLPGPLAPDSAGTVWLTAEEARRLPPTVFRSPLTVAALADWLAGRRYPLAVVRPVAGSGWFATAVAPAPDRSSVLQSE